MAELPCHFGDVLVLPSSGDISHFGGSVCCPTPPTSLKHANGAKDFAHMVWDLGQWLMTLVLTRLPWLQVSYKQVSNDLAYLQTI